MDLDDARFLEKLTPLLKAPRPSQRMLLGGACAAACLPPRRRCAPPLCCASGDEASDAAAPPRRSFRLQVAYDGGAYAGFQLQPAHQGDSVQRRLEAALGKLLNEPRGALGLACAARTDAGVHAAAQVVSFTAAREPRRGAAGLTLSLNGLLPDDVRVLSCQEAPPGFSARFDALGKRYSYALDNAPVADPLRRRYAAHLWQPLDVDAMRAAAALFLGTHDFSAFANVATVEREPVRYVHRCDVLELGAQQLRVEVEGTGFLYRQVRNMVGALCLVGQGAAPPGVVREALASRRRVPKLKSAPAHGLCLARVFYPGDTDVPQQLAAAARELDARHAAAC